MMVTNAAAATYQPPAALTRVFFQYNDNKAPTYNMFNKNDTMILIQQQQQQVLQQELSKM